MSTENTGLKPKKWVAKWDEVGITIATADDRKALGLAIQHFVANSMDKLRGRPVTIKITEVE